MKKLAFARHSLQCSVGLFFLFTSTTTFAQGWVPLDVVEEEDVHVMDPGTTASFETNPDRGKVTAAAAPGPPPQWYGAAEIRYVFTRTYVWPLPPGSQYDPPPTFILITAEGIGSGTGSGLATSGVNYYGRMPQGTTSTHNPFQFDDSYELHFPALLRSVDAVTSCRAYASFYAPSVPRYSAYSETTFSDAIW